MSSERAARDPELLDALDAFPREPFDGVAWRVVREGRDPILGHPSGGRWDPAAFDVLYTALDRDGACAEMHFHLSRQPVFPSTIRFGLHRIAVKVPGILRLAEMSGLTALGVDAVRYGEVAYGRTQEIGDAADFLGFDGLITPNARWPCLNLTLFTDRIEPAEISIQESEIIDLVQWKKGATSGDL